MPRTKHKYGAKAKGKYRSKLEMYCAGVLKQNNIPFRYEELTFELLPSIKPSHESWEKWGKSLRKRKTIQPTTYTPDFVGKGWIIETKGMRTPDFNIKWKMFRHYLEENSLDYTLFMPTNQREVNWVVDQIASNKWT